MCPPILRSYWRNPDKKWAAIRITNLKAARAKLKWYRQYYVKHRKGICASRRSRYALAEPKGSVIEVHMKKIQHQLLANAGAKLELVEAFTKQSKTAAKQLPKSILKIVCVIAAKRLFNKGLASTQRACWDFAQDHKSSPKPEDQRSR